jgi:predicted esterase
MPEAFPGMLVPLPGMLVPLPGMLALRRVTQTTFLVTFSPLRAMRTQKPRARLLRREEATMFRQDGARPARTMAMVCTALGLAAMIVAPLARTATATTPTATPTATAAPTATAIPTATPTPAATVAEQPPARRHAPESPAWEDAEAFAGKAFVYPPQGADGTTPPRPVTVMLHGMCGHPQSACAPFVDVSTSRGWLVCPRAEDACGGGTRWRLHGPDDGQLVEGSVRALVRSHEGEVDASAPRVIVGFSLGGIAAVQIAQGTTGRYAGLVVVASLVHPDAAALKKAGVKRVVLAAGDLDMTSAPLQEDARTLQAQGVPTRFVSLGKFGHGYPADMEERMREPMTWVAGAGEKAAVASGG